MQPVDDRGREVSRILAGRYEVLGLLGRGGFAAVYQVRNLRLQRLEALKVVAGSHETNAEFIRRFEQESRVAASLEHPNILKVYDFGHDAGTLWYSMPFVDGPTLSAELRRRGTFEEAAAARIVVPLLDALEYSHGRGVIHRDIKLDNILLDRRDRPYLMDFGIAKTDDSLVKTQTGFVLGSPVYISPEQLRGERLDGRTDVYALGVSLFQMVSGSVPFKSDRMSDLASRIVSDAPRLATRKPEVSAEMDRIVARALARVRDERYPGAREMRKDLEAFLGRPATDTSPVPAADPASMEVTASVPALPSPLPAPAIVPPPPPKRRVSAVVAVPASPPPAAPEPAAPPAARSRANVLAAAIAAGLIALVAAAAWLAKSRGPAPAPAPTAAPALPTTAPLLPTAVPPLPPAPAVATAAPTPVPVEPTRVPVKPTRVPATPTPVPAPPRPSRIPAAAAPAASPAPRVSPTEPARAVAMPAAPRRPKTLPDVEELGVVPLTPEQERVCGGKVVGVAVEIAEDGRLLSRRVISPASATCDALALEVLVRSRYRPAIDEKGRPVEGRFAFVVRF